MPEKFFYTLSAGKHEGRYKTNLISLKAVLTFQTLMLGTLGKWATTHNRVFFLGKNSAAWIKLTTNTDNLLLISVAFEVTEHILFL